MNPFYALDSFPVKQLLLETDYSDRSVDQKSFQEPQLGLARRCVPSCGDRHRGTQPK
jgi:hypothetical protein